MELSMLIFVLQNFIWDLPKIKAKAPGCSITKYSFEPQKSFKPEPLTIG